MTTDKKTNRTFRERIASTKPTRWVRFGIISVLFFLWVIWMGNAWLALLWLLLADIYITGYIPLTWWKSKKGPVRAVMAWVDAIVYALVLVYVIFAFIGQNYKIPSSSLEKSLLVGDYLWVNKTIYGPRVPQTPLHFPLAQHTLPIINTQSYVSPPELEYHRLDGIRSVEQGDIVVFNYPQGDTVATLIPNPDYYQISYDLKRNGVDNPLAYMKQHPEMFGQIVVRPVDRRENYVKRAIGLPGQRLLIRNDSVFLDGVLMKNPENVQFNYIIPVSGIIPENQWKEIGVRAEDHGSEPVKSDYAGFSFYNVPLTAAMKAEVEKWPQVIGPLRTERESGFYDLGSGIFPLGSKLGWDRANIGELWIPKRGDTLHLTPENYPVYERAIRTYEGNDLRIDPDGRIFINGKETQYYTFKLDYYWMMGDNRDRSADSRYWGFVPEDHIVGSPMFIIASFDEERGLFDGKIRWERILRDANPYKK